MRRLVATASMSVLLLTGCATDSGDPTAGTPPGTSTSAGAESLLARYHLDGKTPAQLVDHLDRLDVEDRPADLTASVRPTAVVISGGGQEYTLDLPGDRFYLSVAPYVDQTHDCFYHSLTTCRGELAGQEIRVKLTDDTHDTVLVDEARTTFGNGFVGFWLPRDIDGTLRISHGGKIGETKIATGEDAPTCLTTLRLR